MRYASAIIVLFLVYSHRTSADFPFETPRPQYVGARALGMGNAFTAIADGATAGFWNPAGLIQGQGVKIFGATKLHDRNDYAFDPKGIGYTYRGYALFWGNKIALGVESGTPDFNYYAFARQITAYSAVGASIKFKRKHPSERYQFFGTHPSYDFALLIKPYPNLKFGLLAHYLPNRSGIQWLTLGAAYRWRELLIAWDTALPGLDLRGTDFYLGAEWRAVSFLHVRGGLSNKDWTIGFGFHWMQFKVDYARIYESYFASDFISGELQF